MSKLITIEVTQEDIASGSKWNCYKCPIALAIQRVTKCMSDWAGPEQVQLFGVMYSTPDIARSWMEQFDRTGRVEALAFEMSCA